MENLYYFYLFAGLLAVVVVVAAITATDRYILWKATPEGRARIFVAASLALLGLELLDYLWTGRGPRFGPQAMFLVIFGVCLLISWIVRRSK